MRYSPLVLTLICLCVLISSIEAAIPIPCYSKHPESPTPRLYNVNNYGVLSECYACYPSGCFGLYSPYTKTLDVTGDIPKLGPYFNDSVRSIHVPKGYCLDLYKDPNYGGGPPIRCSSDTAAGYRDISSVRLIKEPYCCNAHNIYRSQVGVPALVWSNSLAASAQQWANNLAKNNPTCIGNLHDKNWGGGENIACGFSDIDSAVHYWAKEKKCFKNDIFPNTYNGQCNADSNCKECGKNWCCAGHYSQIVWRNNKEVGCGISNGIVVCRYNPGGNMAGQKAY